MTINEIEAAADESELEAIRELMSMQQKELDLVPYIIMKWICQAKGCKCFTRVRDYGIAPIYWRNKMTSVDNSMEYNDWHNTDEVFLVCGKHSKLVRRLMKKGYSTEHIHRRLYDGDKYPRVIPIAKKERNIFKR